MDTRPLESEEREALRRGLAYFRRQDYFSAHDDWEEVWRDLSGRRRLFWQAMIQLAVGTHHWQNDNMRGCRSVWQKALQKCDDLSQLYDDEVPDALIFLIDLISECLIIVDHGGDPQPTLTDYAIRVMSEQWFDLT